mgnify:CR=1 FL=1
MKNVLFLLYTILYFKSDIPAKCSTEFFACYGVMLGFFLLSILILLYFLYRLIQENHKLKAHQKEQDILQDYVKKMEDFYEEFRVFRHDYKNILSTLTYYIEAEDIPQLKVYFEKKILPYGETLSAGKYVLGKLHLIKIPVIKSILFSKLAAALNKGLSPTVELTEPLTDIFMDELKLSRILGILMDNAIESSLQTFEKIIAIAIVLTEESILFSFTNSTLPIGVPVSKLYEKGYTTKENHDGLGLYTVKKISDSLNNVSYIAQYDGMFHQILEITKGQQI